MVTERPCPQGRRILASTNITGEACCVIRLPLHPHTYIHQHPCTQNTLVMHENTHNIHLTPLKHNRVWAIHQQSWETTPLSFIPSSSLSYLQLCLGGSNPESSQSRPGRFWWPSWRPCWLQWNLSRPDSLSPQLPRCISSSSSHRSSWSLPWPSSMSAVCKSRSRRGICTPASWSASQPEQRGLDSWYNLSYGFYNLENKQQKYIP